MLANRRIAEDGPPGPGWVMRYGPAESMATSARPASAKLADRAILAALSRLLPAMYFCGGS